MSRLILLRHGESTWNAANRFTGWTDVDLTEKGVKEAREAAALMKMHGIRPDWCCTSYLKRSIRTLWIVLDEMDLMWLPVAKHWRLNERHYGALQGLNKAETADRVGDRQVHAWRRSYATTPPALEKSDARFPGRDPRYALLTEDELPLAESLKDTVDRFMPYWKETLSGQCTGDRTVLVSAHGNSLRAIVKFLDRVADDDIPNVEIPTGNPLCYRLDENLNALGHEYLLKESGDR